MKWFLKAEKAGDITSSYEIGEMYENGLGVKQDYSKAIQQYEKAAKREDHVGAPAMRDLSRVYGKLGDKDKAAYWADKAATAETK